jgi:hypothetical protein
MRSLLSMLQQGGDLCPVSQSCTDLSSLPDFLRLTLTISMASTQVS